MCVYIYIYILSGYVFDVMCRSNLGQRPPRDAKDSQTPDAMFPNLD